MEQIMTFPRKCEFDKARSCLDRLGLPYEAVSPAPGYGRVGVQSLVMSQEARGRMFQEIGTEVVSAGWVDYRPARVSVPATPPASFEEDILGTCAIVVMAPCVADLSKIRLIAHISGDLTGVLPYLNAEMAGATYCRDAETLTYMEGYRLVSLYPRRLTVAKADELVDAWRTLEGIRCLVNETWRRRGSISPSWEMRRKPPALEIYKRLPGTNCRACGEKTCMAFALGLWNGAVDPSLCTPVFSGEHGHLKAPLLEICSSLGLAVGAGALEDA
jgi:ArsR family metal-binding transcriptional regulator